MSYYLYNKKNEMYCEPLHAEFWPQICAVGFDTSQRALEFGCKLGLGKKNIKVKKHTGLMELLIVGAIDKQNICADVAFMFVPTILEAQGVH